MNKKFLSAILFGALMVTSTGTFVSCKDYDEDIENLQGQIDKLATKDELASQVATLNAALSAASSSASDAIAKATAAETAAKAAGDEAAAAKAIADKAAAEAEAAAIAALQEELAAAKAELEDLIAAGSGENADALAAMNKTVKAVETKVEALLGEVSGMVTSIALWTADHNADDTHSWIGYGKECNDHFLSFAKIQEYDNVFPAKEGVANKQYTFKKGNSVTYTDEIIVRVSPTNATLVPENIALINSKGEDLTDLVYVEEVKPYEELLTFSRAAANNGLWKVTFKLRENYDADAFAAAVAVKENNVVKNIRFAVAVTNTAAEEGSAARRVISGYELGVEAVNGNIANNWFLVDGKSVNEIHNRYYAAEDGTSTRKVKELTWLDNSKPAVAPILEGKGVNAADRYNNFDNRQYNSILPVVKGQPIKIQIDWNKEANKPYNKIKGFYVTLDSEFAVESVPSEINAWNSYEYENVGTAKQAATMIDGNEGTITIKDMNNVKGDIIGFRVYAVNLDGTLVDPDGRAFYVVVGDEVAQASIQGTVVANALNVSTDFIDVAGKFVDCNTMSWSVSQDNPVYAGQNVWDTQFTINYYDKDKKQLGSPSSAVKYVKLVVNNVARLIDGETYTQTYELKKFTDNYGQSSNNYTEWSDSYSNYTMPLAKITVQLTKVMPTEFPENFAFRPKQEVEDGSGKFVAYMIPEYGYSVANMSANGIKDLNNVFYGLDDNYSFVFGTSTKDADGNNVSLAPVTYNPSFEANPTEEMYYPLWINQNPNKYIDNTTWHSVTASYIYKGVSTYYDAAKEVWHVGVNYGVDYNKTLEAKYACWHDASAFAWGTYKVTINKETVTKSYKPELQWTAEGNTVATPYSHIVSTNSYNNDYFGLDLNVLINTNEWLKIKKDSYKLTVNGQVNPYFKPEMTGNTITFTQIKTQVDAAPVADHDENLVFTVIDAFGHEKEISLVVTIKAPEKK